MEIRISHVQLWQFRNSGHSGDIADMRKRKYFTAVCLLTTILLAIQHILNIDFEIWTSRQPKMKYILYWTEMFHQADFNLGLGSEIFEKCSVSNCFATNNKTLLPVADFDALLFHGVEYNSDVHGKPENRSAHQIYVYSNQEAPTNTPVFERLDNFYNWTMTYRSDSEIIRPYGFFEHKNTDYILPSIEEIRNRSRKIAWLVSNCDTQSLRNRLYENINKYMDVDVYGNCGNLTCPKEDKDKCYDFLEKHYKFYLSFENAYCRDYATEKVFNVLQKNLVPIVYGWADYDKIAPPHSVIDVTKFDSAKSLVAYLRMLDENPAKYMEYFMWKRSYVVDTSNRFALCRLCEKLNEQHSYKVYDNIDNWWRNTAGTEICKMRNSLPKIVVDYKKY
ncbi:unnamed protein product [Phaedon cochleariae]|uniref:Fucosyltransferase n=1 Tax=Phaedon cochleariae TaxID=80249 RepID=A0A9N9X3J5_PHACE|nr:unnamed protein product [Phaedon cochleariae]